MIHNNHHRVDELNKDLFLLGSGIQQTIIDAQNQDYGIKMYGANVPDNSVIHIEGFTIINAGNGQGQGAGIFLNGFVPSGIDSNHFSANFLACSGSTFPATTKIALAGL